MEPDGLKRALALGKRLGQAFVVTADGDGVPHMASARRLEPAGDHRISLSEWFCPGTLSNLQVNPHISVVVWDSGKDEGFQMIGDSEGISERSMLDGFTGGPAEVSHVPQVEREILVRVERVIRFSQAPHSDQEE